MQDTDQRVVDAARIADDEPDPKGAIHQFRARWGLSDDEAEKLYEDVLGYRKSQRRRKFITGVLGAIGLALFAESFGLLPRFIHGGWGIVFQAALLVFVVGVSVQITYTGWRKGRLGNGKTPVWKAYAVFGFLILVTAGNLAYSIWRNVGVDTPGDSDMTWVRNELQAADASTVVFSGEITNNSNGWSMTEPRLHLIFYDDDRVVVSEPEYPLTEQAILPGDSYLYSQDVEMLPSYSTYDSSLLWNWKKVD